MTSKPEKTARHARFMETARKLECDEDDARFKEKLGRIAKVKPPQKERDEKAR